jgi:hypothetical protein
MLSQPESLFNFRDIMDRGMILLVNLSGVGSMVRSILGCFILSLMHLTALSRSSVARDDRKQFHIHCDEAHRFMTDSLEDLIAETRKYKVSLSLAHQYMSQFGKRKTDAFSSVGSTIIFNVDSRDAGYLVKDLQKKVKVEDLVSLEVGEAIARIGTEIVRFKTHPPLPIPKRHFKERIVQESRRKYCRPASEVREWIRRRGERWNSGFSPLSPCVGGIQADWRNSNMTNSIDRQRLNRTLDTVLQLLAESHIVRIIDEPVQRATTSFVYRSPLSDPYLQFVDTASRFYAYLCECVETFDEEKPPVHFQREWMNLFETRYRTANGSGFHLAYLDALEDTESVLSHMAGGVVSHLRERHTRWVYFKWIAGLEWDDKCEFVKTLFDRTPFLPESILKCPPASMADRIFELISAVVYADKAVQSLIFGDTGIVGA